MQNIVCHILIRVSISSQVQIREKCNLNAFWLHENMHNYFLKKIVKILAKRKVKKIQMHLCIYVCMYSVCPEQPIPKLLFFLILNNRSVLLLLSVFPSIVSASESRKLLVAEAPALLSQCVTCPGRPGCAGTEVQQQQQQQCSCPSKHTALLLPGE